MKNQGRKSITLSLQVSVISNIPSGNRIKQSAEFTVTAPGVSEPKKFTANLLPKEEFVSFDNSSPAVDKTGGVATFDNKKSLYSNTSSQYVKQS